MSLPYNEVGHINNADELCEHLHRKLMDERKNTGMLRELLRVIKANHTAKYFRLSDRIIHKMKRFEL